MTNPLLFHHGMLMKLCPLVLQTLFVVTSQSLVPLLEFAHSCSLVLISGGPDSVLLVVVMWTSVTEQGSFRPSVCEPRIP